MNVANNYSKIRYKQIFRKEESLFPEKIEMEVLKKLHNLSKNENEVKNDFDGEIGDAFRFSSNRHENSDDIEEFSLFAQDEKKFRLRSKKLPETEDEDV